jgi:hypothetical protein
MISYLLPFLLLWQTTDIPFRPNTDFHLELKYDLKQRPQGNPNSVSLDQAVTERRNGGGSLPYLTVKLKMLNAKAEEVRFKCENNFGKAIFNKKAEKTLAYEIDLGFIDDLKDRVEAHAYTVYAQSDKKQSLNKIELIVMEDGTFMVNGERRGKF